MNIDKINISPSLRRSSIIDFEKELLVHPDVLIGDNELCPLKHSFSNGIYVREIFIPKGMVLTGKIHKHSHPNFLMKGKVSVFTEGQGLQKIKAPYSMISEAGTKRVVYAHTDVVWITVHYNPDNCQDLLKLEDMIIAKDFKEINIFNIQSWNCY